MPNDHALRDGLHDATHRVPGVPPHADHPEGHQGAGRTPSLQSRGAGPHHGSAPAHDRPPRVLVGWQNWIAGFFARTPD
ncbi:hypothetical protein [Cellulomonas sp. ICMP 17802]|uniref:hypothetical protein n=1 Tax=Cellulomonas sp. ICMP 17802 TaxID=3239199 RepID=UPI00351AC41D